MSVPGRVIAGRYELSAAIGRGGMGQVWKAYDQTLQRRVAVKLLRTDLFDTSGDRGAMELRFLRECRVTAGIDHPGLVTVFDGGTDDGDLYLVMQLLDGCDLADLIAENQPVPWDWAVAVAAQICSVLAAVHAVPVVHRDLKPRNVMVRRDGTVKVLDLGVAAVLDPESTKLTTTGAMPGSPAYMAPEQMNGIVEPRTDLYALGCLMYEMLSGRAPFAGPTMASVMLGHLNGTPEPLAARRPDIPAGLELLIMQLLGKQPDQRPANAQEVYRRLVPLLPTAGADAAAALAPTAPMDPTRPLRFPAAPQPLPGVPAPVRAPAPTPAPWTMSAGPPAPPRPNTDWAAVPSAAPPTLDVGSALDEANRLLGEGALTQAVDVLGAALPVAIARHGERDPLVLGLRQALADTLLADRQFRRALPELQYIAGVFAAEGGPTDPEAMEYGRQVGACLEELGDLPAALGEYRRLLDLHRRIPDGDVYQGFDLRERIGLLLAALGDPYQAESVLVPLLAEEEHRLGPQHPRVLTLRQHVGRMHGATGFRRR
ncbi:protein kinase domain-containing protein [Embleya sp. NBC_00896]|uniref:serine/threonine-protein kinase n=1 Tax=Embleya sp. NBC_00896 TaxID=2975961 RepID=UPI00386D1F71|nr:protein kinase [Embleya sp. NBC_00896]